MRTYKRVFAVCLCLLLLAGLFPAALAEEADEKQGDAIYTISTLGQFLTFAKKCALERYSLGRHFVLATDIDLSGEEFEPIPYFAGTFDGRNHLIRGLQLSAEGSRQGLFRQIGEGAVVKNLRVQGSVTPAGSQSYVGGLAGVNCGTILRCSFEGEVRGIENIGGLVGHNAESGVVSQSGYRGSMTGEHQVGGIVGLNQGVILDCAGSGEVNTVAVTPVGETSFDLASFSQDEFLSLTNIGGIAGENTGVISGCRNAGSVGYKYTGYNVGGIVGKTSGFVGSCVNSGQVEGRRDVGGIAGQLIPYAAWEFSNGRLEQLTSEINGMKYLVSEASRNANNQSAELRKQLGTMNNYTSSALTSLSDVLRQVSDNDRRIIDSIQVNRETGEVSFPSLNLNTLDTGGLTSALNNMYAQSTVLSGMIGNSVASVATDLNNINSQMTRIFDVLFSIVSDASQGDFISTRDLSFEEAYEHDEGAVAECENQADIRAETNAGGIVGTIAFEIAFDMEDQLDASNFLTTNAQQYLFAAVRGCRSDARIQSRNDNAGGIVARMDVGAVVNCIGAGSVSSQSGGYVGGIIGTAQGTVSGCWARAELRGEQYVGGIAGLGDDLLDNRAWPHIEQSSEYKGSVAGWAEGTVSGNLYVGEDLAGVDNVSRVDQAEPVLIRELLALEDAPEDFDTVTVRFLQDEHLRRECKVPFGGNIESLPEVQNRGAEYWVWDEFDMDHIYYSMDISGSWYSPASTISTGEEIPLFLVEGSFYDGQALTVTPCDIPADMAAEDVLDACTLTVNDYEGALTVRMLAEDGGKIVLLSDDGSRTEVPVEKDGRYLVFQVENGSSFVRLSETKLPLWPWFVGGGVLILALSATFLIKSKRKKASAAE